MLNLRSWQRWRIVALAVAAIGIGWKSWPTKNSGPEYRAGKIEKGSINPSVSASGILSPVLPVQVGSQVSTQPKEIRADHNSEVRQGQLITRIAPETFEYRVRQLQADWETARVAVNAASARRNLDRRQELIGKGFHSDAERDTIMGTYGALAEQVKADNAQVQVLRYE